MESGTIPDSKQLRYWRFTFFYYDVKLTKAKYFLISFESIIKHYSTATFTTILMVLLHCSIITSGLHKTLILELHLVNNFTMFQKAKTQTVTYSSHQVGT